MAKFRAVYMKCTNKQLERMRPKLESVGCELSIYAGDDIKKNNILSNNICNENIIGNIHKRYLKSFNGQEVHTEAEFLEACGYVEQETLQEKEQRLIKELEEVRIQIKENEPKVWELVIAMSIETNKKAIYKLEECHINHDFFKIIKLPKEIQEQLKPYFNV